MENYNFFKSVLLSSILISALVGGVFGYYAPRFRESMDKQVNILQGRSTEEEGQVIKVVNIATPAVVNIAVNQTVTLRTRSPLDSFLNDPFFRQFFGDIETPVPRATTQKQQVSAGTGFIVSSDGLILTNKHVVDFKGSGTELIVTVNDGKKYPANLVSLDPAIDLAVIKINAVNLPKLDLGDSSSLKIGQTVVAIGNALGELTNTVSKGVISGLSRSLIAQTRSSAENLSELIQTDAAINPGNSGGPLLNLTGHVIGINTAIAQGAQNIGFAIPINQAKAVINNLMPDKLPR